VPPNISLSNTWTYTKHGHAQHELRKIEEFLLGNGISSRIVRLEGVLENQPPYISLGLLGHKLKLDHRKVFKGIIDRKLLWDLARRIEVANDSYSYAHHRRIAFLSCRYNQILEICKKLNRNFEYRFRLLDCPKSKDEWKSFANFISSFSNKINLGWEDYETSEVASEFLGNSIHVPNAYSLERSEMSKRSRRRYVGVFWPIASGDGPREVHSFLEELEGIPIKVKLPSNVDKRSLGALGKSIEYIKSNMSDYDYIQELHTIAVGILPHKNYLNRGSGYASYFATNGIPFFARPSNTFVSELSEFTDIHEYSDSATPRMAEVLALLDGQIIPRQRRDYYEYSSQQWRMFLLS
jgi:hypothetical protein